MSPRKPRNATQLVNHQVYISPAHYVSNHLKCLVRRIELIKRLKGMDN